MAKKSGGGLDPGADATIVAAAYRAGMAGVPKDLSKTFQGIATGYTKAMDKMGAGLAKAAEVGASIAAPLIESSIADYKTKTSKRESVPEEYGESFINSIYGVNGEGGFLNELKEEKQAWKNMSGPERKEAKRKWKQKRDNGFAYIRQLQSGEFLNTALIAEGDANLLASGNEGALLQTALQLKGKPLPEGHPQAGMYLKSVFSENGKIELQLTAPDGRSVSGINDDGTIEYHSEEDIVTGYDLSGTTRVNIGKAASGSGPVHGTYRDSYLALGGTPRNISKETPLAGLNRFSVTNDGDKRTVWRKNPNYKGVWALETADGSNSYGMRPDVIKGLQEHLNSVGIKGEDGKSLKVDGKIGKNTRHAYETYLENQDKLEKESLDKNLSEDEDFLADFPNVKITTPSTTKPLTVTPENIEKLIVPKDYKMRTGVTKMHDAELQNGYKGWDFQENDIRRQLNENIRTSAQLSDAMHAPFGNSDGTYAEYLGKPNAWTQEMYSVLENMSGIQDIGEPGIDADDFVGEQGAANMTILRKEMLNVNNPSSKKMFIDWQTEEIRKQHATGKARYDKEQRSKGSDKTTSVFQGYQGKGWVPASSQETWFGNLSRREDFEGHYDNYKWDGNNYINSEGESMSLWEVATIEQITAKLPATHEVFQSAGSTTGGGGSTLGSTHRKTINALWDNPAEDTAFETLNTMLTTLGIDKRVDVPWGPGASEIRLDGVTYNLRTAEDKNKLITKILELQGGQQTTVTNFG